MEAYYDSDASLEVLHHQILGIIGYGKQGRAQALNLRAGQTLDFAQGYNIRFGLIAPPGGDFAAVSSADLL